MTENRLVQWIATGEAPREVFRIIAAEESRIVPSDQRSFLCLAARAEDGGEREFFAGLASGEGVALEKLKPLVEATGAGGHYEPLSGCQTYPSFMAWMALNAKPADVIVELNANFAAFGEYCATIAQAMRVHYGFDEEACGFFDFFGTPAEEVASSNNVSPEAKTYTRLFHDYELQFWNTIADAVR